MEGGLSRFSLPSAVYSVFMLITIIHFFFGEETHDMRRFCVCFYRGTLSFMIGLIHSSFSSLMKA